MRGWAFHRSPVLGRRLVVRDECRSITACWAWFHRLQVWALFEALVWAVVVGHRVIVPPGVEVIVVIRRQSLRGALRDGQDAFRSWNPSSLRSARGMGRV